MAKLPPEVSSRNQSQMAPPYWTEKTPLPSFVKRGLGGKPLYFLFFMILVPTASTLSVTRLQTAIVVTSKPKEPTPDHMTLRFANKLSLRTPKKGLNLCLVFIVSNTAFWE